jgi:branched-chain amino acid transport system permease protein
MIVGFILIIETAVHFSVNPGDDSHIRAFGVPFDAASPSIWGLAVVLAAGGFLVARRTWQRVGRAWDEAAGTAREKGAAA